MILITFALDTICLVLFFILQIENLLSQPAVMMRNYSLSSSSATFLITVVAVIISTVAVILSTAAVPTSAAAVLHLDRVTTVNSTVERLAALDRTRHSRLFSGLVNFPVYGSADPFYYGFYFTKVKLGTPAQEYNLLIDTGSDLTWVSSKSCPSCPRSSQFTLNPYDPAASTTSRVVRCSDKICAAQCSADHQYCGYTLRYKDGSTASGVYVTDIYHFESIPSASTTPNSSASILFGVSSYRGGNLADPGVPIDGIIGLGKGSVSVVSQLYYSGITPQVFSHCLKGGGIGGGVFVFGAISAPGIVYTPLVPARPHYTINLESIAVDGQLLPVDPRAFAPSMDRGTIVDTGTTFAFLVEEAYDPFVQSVTAAVSKFAAPTMIDGRQCFATSSRVFPPVKLNFAGGASMALKPEDYLVLNNDGSKWCIGFRRVQGVSILGDLVIKDKLFIYDLIRQRLGWVEYDCSSSVNVSASNGDFFSRSGSSSSSVDWLFHWLPAAILAALWYF